MIVLLLVLFGFVSQSASAAELPTLEQAIHSENPPAKIQGTGKRESIEPEVKGQKEGRALYYYPNGQLYGIINWRAGQKTGAFKLYREDGSLEQRLEYDNGQPHGLEIWLTDEGNIREFAEFVHGVSFGSRKCKKTVPFSAVESDARGLSIALLDRCTANELVKATHMPRPSFDCAKAKTGSEKAICNDPRLARVDRNMNERYKTVITQMSDTDYASDLRQGQLQWLKMREKCAGNTDEIGGLGVSLKRDETITSLVKDGPAERAGIKIGDQITHINNQPVADLSFSEAIERMRGSIGSPVALTLKRENTSQPIKLTLIRQALSVSSSDLIGNCILASMETRMREIHGAYAAYLNSTLQPAPLSEAQGAVADISGTYKRTFPNGDVEGNEFETTDELVIASGSRPDAVKFSVLLNFFNGHVCDLQGEAVYTANQEFVFLDPNLSYEDKTCRFSIRKEEDKIKLDDGENTCRDYCGARGSFAGASFDTSSKQ